MPEIHIQRQIPHTIDRKLNAYADEKKPQDLRKAVDSVHAKDATQKTCSPENKPREYRGDDDDQTTPV